MLCLQTFKDIVTSFFTFQPLSRSCIYLCSNNNKNCCLIISFHFFAKCHVQRNIFCWYLLFVVKLKSQLCPVQADFFQLFFLLSPVSVEFSIFLSSLALIVNLWCLFFNIVFHGSRLLFDMNKDRGGGCCHGNGVVDVCNHLKKKRKGRKTFELAKRHLTRWTSRR